MSRTVAHEILKVPMKYYQTDNCRVNKHMQNDDDLIVALSLALDMSYKDTFSELMLMASEHYCYPHLQVVIDAYLRSKGWMYNPRPRAAHAGGTQVRMIDWFDAPHVAVVKLQYGSYSCWVAIVDSIVHGTLANRTVDVPVMKYRACGYWTPMKESGDGAT